MSLFTWAEKRVKPLKWFDIKLIGLFSILVGLLFAKWFPGLLKVNIWVYVIIALLSIARPFYIIYLKKTE